MRESWGAAAIASTMGLCVSCGDALPEKGSEGAVVVDARLSAPPMPGPARARGSDAVAMNQACEECHQEIATEWRASLHARANIEPAYQRAFAIEPLPFCRSCHAPEADPTTPASTDVSAIGVACVTCHLTERGILAGPAPSIPSDADAPHAVIRSDRFSSPDACAQCHEFRFPGAHGEHAGAFMQHTVSEHAASPRHDVSCAECHMPRAQGGHRMHRFEASRNADILRQAVEVRASREGSHVTVILHPRTLAHAFPTGDLFRRLELLVQSVGPELSLLSEDRTYLARHWAIREHGIGRRLVSDDRLMYEPRRFDFELGPASASADIVWQLAYQRVAHPTETADARAELDGETVLARGVLSAASAEGAP